MSKILIIEDELPILDLIKMNLSLIGHEIHTASDGLEGFNMLQSSTYDLLLIDIMLPKMDGFEILDKINKKSMGIIILSAKFETIDKVRGLKLGADDYITKPFESMELLARVEALLRRCQKEDPITNNIIYKNLELNENERTTNTCNNIVQPHNIILKKARHKSVLYVLLEFPLWRSRNKSD